MMAIYLKVATNVSTQKMHEQAASASYSVGAAPLKIVLFTALTRMNGSCPDSENNDHVR